MSTDNNIFVAPEVPKVTRLGSMLLGDNASATIPELMEASKFHAYHSGNLIRESAVVESTLIRCITSIFDITESQRADFIRSRVIEASFLTFEAKKSIVLSWNSEFNVLTGQTRNEFEKSLSEVIHRRNLIVHGNPILLADKTIKIKYFRGSPVEKKFDPEFINTSSTTFREANNFIKLGRAKARPF